jgi:hypothetical protein
MTTYHHRGFTIITERYSKQSVEYSVSRDSDGLSIAYGSDSGTISSIVQHWCEEIDELIATNGASMDLEEHFMPTAIEATA